MKLSSRRIRLFCSVALVMCWGCGRQAPAPVPSKPLNVFYVTPVAQDVTEEEEFTGRTAPTERIELRARVSGYLQQLDFAEGKPVARDQILFQIDKRPFLAEEKRTAAAVSQFEARALRLESQEQRARSLFEKRAMSEEEYEAVKYEMTEAQASWKASLASHEMARLDLEFTEVRAPIAGMIGQRQVDPGNLVVADQTLLATIVPTEKIYVYFDMDERTVLRLRRMQHSGEIQTGLDEPVTVRIALADADEFSISGVVNFQDNEIDASTGTLRIRATVENAAGLLSPGLFVRIKYPVGGPKSSLLIPEECLASDQGRPFVFVVAASDGQQTAEARYIELGPLLGAMRVVRSGLNAEDYVIATGLQRLRRNAEIIAKQLEPTSKSGGTEVPSAKSTEGKAATVLSVEQKQ
ncbi:MAG: efflux RND transporter periplasmic adaptor subunit [Planctomycetia bacterium]